MKRNKDKQSEKVSRNKARRDKAKKQSGQKDTKIQLGVVF
jgi:hypothetical protein